MMSPRTNIFSFFVIAIFSWAPKWGFAMATLFNFSDSSNEGAAFGSLQTGAISQFDIVTVFLFW
jgi:hypothetical protein